MRPVLLAALALLGAGLLAAIALELQWPGSEPETAAAPVASGVAPAAAPVAALGDDASTRAVAVQTVLARPLFSPTRRPPAAAAAAAATPAATLPRMTAILIDGDRRSAIFAATGTGKPTVIDEGGRLGAFTVQTIEAQQVTVVGPDGKRTLRTSFDPNPPLPVATVQPSLPPIPGPAQGQILGGPPGLAPAAAPGVAR